MNEKRIFSVQLDTETRAKLDQLSEATERSRGGVLRLLIRHADIREEMTITAPKAEHSNGSDD
jgi:predicted transcriptional regulator